MFRMFIYSSVFVMAVSGCNCRTDRINGIENPVDAGIDAGPVVDAGKVDAGLPDAGKPDAGKPDAGTPPPCFEKPDGTSCGATQECSRMECQGGACVSRPFNTGNLCGMAEACRPRGVCTAGVCDQPPATTCGTGDIQISVTWDNVGRDMELHLIRPGGHLNDSAGSDCTWTTCIFSSPDWGVAGDPNDDPKKDVDNVFEFGPENIFLKDPENGTFAVMVEHWADNTSPSDVQVTVKVNGTPHTFSTSGLPSHYVWDVARIDWPSGTVTQTNSTIDCRSSWSSGCTMSLP